MMTAKPKHAHLNSHPPSQAVLAVLALVATIPPVVAGAPLHPPAFLCPYIERDNILADSTPPPAPTNHPTKCDVVADRFVQGLDNLWRKTDRWSLYGSTCSFATRTSAVPPQKTPSQTPVPTSANAFDMSVLPAGWDHATTVKSNTESTIILALAIVLAGLICLFMIGCVIWRRRKKKARDVERKLGHRPGPSRENWREEDARGKMRIWAKATARWKSSIRQSARRRRKRQCLSSSANRSLSPTPSDSPRLTLATPPTSSRRVSTTSEDPCHNDNVIEFPVLHAPPRSVSPPTYGASFVPRFPRSSPSSAVPGSIRSIAGSHSVRRSVVDDEPLPYVPPSDGHVATDDKSQFAHIRQLASSPPMTVDATNTSAMQCISAPDWHEAEDDLEDLDIDLTRVSTSYHDFHLPPSFPLPPFEADVPSPFRYLDDCAHRSGEGRDDLVFPPIPGSPRPSLGAFPGAPPMDEPGLEPSAPSLEIEDELFQDWYGASTPYVPEVSTPDPTPVCAIESSTSAPRTSFPKRESAGRDGILPRYRP